MATAVAAVSAAGWVVWAVVAKAAAAEKVAAGSEG